MQRLFKRCLGLLLFAFLLCFSIRAQDTGSGNSFYKHLQPAPVNGGFKMKDYWVWGGSVIRGNDGKYYMFASRWPKYLPFHPGWMINSEIVRAISDNPKGPYTFQEVVLPARGPEFWDGRSTHNPKVLKYKNTYILYYIGSTHPFAQIQPGQEDTLTLISPYTTVGRANIRIGIATSKNMEGQWKRYDQPILKTKTGTFYSFMTSNPAPLIRDDGSVLLIFKSRAYKDDFPFQTHMRIGVASAPSFKGPYKVISDGPVFGKNQIGEVEDPCIWEDSDGIHMLVKDMSGDISGEKHAGILVHSRDGLHWKLDPHPLAYSRKIKWDDGTVKTMGQLERPSLLMENGKPAYLFFATMDGPGGFKNGTKSWNMAIPLEQP